MAALRASENRTIDQVMNMVPRANATITKVLDEVGPHCPRVSPGARILEMGTAQGLYVNILTNAGFDARGIEPWHPAIETSRKLEARTGVKTNVIEAWAENLPFRSEEFDFVFAISVMEHVRDPMAVSREVHRVLRPDGGFYFHTTSALGLRQNEIRGFPLFKWYPAPVKRRVMWWAAENRPSLIDGTAAPAIHWYTPWGVRRDLGSAGFRQVLDRWDLKRDDQFDGWRRRALRMARPRRSLRLIGDFVKPGSGYLAVK
jgi:SAM-dependent methyltransferase